MRGAARRLVAGIAVLVLCLPASMVLTIVRQPLWAWLERTHDIESVGHSGPADWCFLATYVLRVAFSAGACFA